MKNEFYYSANSLMRDLRFVYALGIVFRDLPSVRYHFKAIIQSGLDCEEQIQIYINILHLAWIFLNYI